MPDLDLRDPKVAAWIVIYESLNELLAESRIKIEEYFSPLKYLLEASLDYDPQTGEPSFLVSIVMKYDPNDQKSFNIIEEVHTRFYAFNHNFWYGQSYQHNSRLHFDLDFRHTKSRDGG